MMIMVVRVMVLLARLWKKGIRIERMTCTIRVWVTSDSTNQAVWNNFSKWALAPSLVPGFPKAMHPKP